MASRLQRLRRGDLPEAFLLAGPRFRRAAPWLLALVLLAGLLARLHPALRYAVWGSDSGEYLFLTQRLVDTGRASFEYDGWGLAYPYFPGMFVLSGAVHAVLGVDVFHATQLVTPVLAACIPVLLGLLAYRITSDPRAAIVAGAFAALTGALVLTTSHAMPGTLGQVFMLGLLALLPDAHRDRRHLLLFAVLGAALVLTHHLTTYFAVGILAFVPFYRELSQRATDVQRLRTDVPLVLGLLAMTAVWWLMVATPFRDEIVGDALKINPWVTAAAFILALGALPALVAFKRARTDWVRTPRYPPFPRQRLWVTSIFFGLAGLVLFLILVRLPGTDIRLEWATLLYVLPVLGFIAFLPLGMAAVHFYRSGVVVVGWLYAVLASLAFAIVTNNRVLFPFRHIDYMVMAMGPLVAIGMLMVYDQALASRPLVERPRVRANLLAAFVALLVVSAALSLPPRETIGGFEEGIGANEMAAVEWARDNLPRNSTFAADHRVSSLLFGLGGMHPSWDYTPRTYHSANVSEALEELAAAKVPPRDGPTRIDYVFLSPQIEAGVTLLQWENSEPMGEEAKRKFDDPAVFEKVYDRDGARIYRVLWPA